MARIAMASCLLLLLSMPVASASFARPPSQEIVAPSSPQDTVQEKFRKLDAQAQNTSWHKAQLAKTSIPPHIKKAVRAARQARGAGTVIQALPMVALGGCGVSVPVATLGLKPSAKAAALLSTSIHRASGPGFEVASGACVAEGSCVSRGAYGNSEACSIEVTGTPKPLEVREFDVEGYWDFLNVNGRDYDGRGVDQGPEGVIPTGTITWTTDGSVTLSGFKICFPEPTEHQGASSWAQPGVGANQAVADNGRSTTGSVNGEEVFVKVLKDGFFQVGCFNDAMLEHGDKFGSDKDKYGSVAESANISIAKYSELVLKDEQVEMTPRVCFELCRTIQGMVFFGIRNGNECYCDPYFKPQAGDDTGCDVPCAGDATQMCGSQSKSTIWEMHLCADTAEDLQESAVAGEEALTFFHESAALAVKLGKTMTAAGDALEDVAGLSGSPESGDLGMSAKQAGGDLSKAFMAGRKAYETLFGATMEARGLEGGDFTSASVASKAERAVELIKDTEGQVLGFAAGIHDLVMSVHPAADYQGFGEPPPQDMLVKQVRDGTEATDFRLAPYAMGEANLEPEASTCSGETIGRPMLGLGVNGCGIACEQTLYPKKCVAFSHYQVEGTEDLCFLFSEVDDVETFEPPPTGLVQRSLRKATLLAAGSPASAVCKVKMSEVATGFKPKGTLKRNKRCFGACGGFAAREGTESYAVPSTVEVQGKEVIPKLP